MPPRTQRTAARTRDYKFSDEIDPSLQFFYEPRNLLVLVLFLFVIIYTAFNDSVDHLVNVKVYSQRIYLQVAVF